MGEEVLETRARYVIRIGNVLTQGGGVEKNLKRCGRSRKQNDIFNDLFLWRWNWPLMALTALFFMWRFFRTTSLNNALPYPLIFDEFFHVNLTFLYLIKTDNGVAFVFWIFVAEPPLVRSATVLRVYVCNIETRHLFPKKNRCPSLTPISRNFFFFKGNPKRGTKFQDEQNQSCRFWDTAKKVPFSGVFVKVFRFYLLSYSLKNSKRCSKMISWIGRVTVHGVSENNWDCSH